MCLILEEQEPRLVYSVNLYVDFYRASIYLFRLIELVKSSHLLQILDRDGSQIHKAYRLGTTECRPCSEIIVICLLEQSVFESDFVYDGSESRMSAVVRPISIDHLELGYGRIPELGSAEIVYAERKSCFVHSQPH